MFEQASTVYRLLSKEKAVVGLDGLALHRISLPLEEKNEAVDGTESEKTTRVRTRPFSDVAYPFSWFSSSIENTSST